MGFAHKQYMLHLRIEFGIAIIVYQSLTRNQNLTPDFAQSPLPEITVAEGVCVLEIYYYSQYLYPSILVW